MIVKKFEGRRFIFADVNTMIEISRRARDIIFIIFDNVGTIDWRTYSRRSKVGSYDYERTGRAAHSETMVSLIMIFIQLRPPRLTPFSIISLLQRLKRSSPKSNLAPCPVARQSSPATAIYYARLKSI